MQNRTLLLSMILITAFVNPFMGAAINIALPQIGKEFNLGATGLSWIAMSFLLSSAVFLVPVGRLADILGRKKVFIAGNFVVGLSSLLCAVSPNGWFIIAARIIQGFGAAMMFGTGIAIITSAFPPNERGKAIGYNVSAVYLGLSMAPLLGGILTQSFGWRSLFIATIITGIGVSVVTFIKIKDEWAEAKQDSFDYKGALVYFISMSAAMYGFSKLPDFNAILLTFFGVLGLIFFVVLELRTKSPVLDVSIFASNRVFAFANLAALINYAATFAITFLLSLYLQYIKMLSPSQAGLLLITQPLSMTFAASFSGRLSDKYDSGILASIGMLIIVFGLIGLIFLKQNTENLYIIINLFVLGIGFGLFSSPNTNSVMGSVDRKNLGIASATVGTMRVTGQMLSMGVATMVLNYYVGSKKITLQNHNLFIDSMQFIFTVFAILCFIGVFASLARGRSVKNKTT